MALENNVVTLIIVGGFAAVQQILKTRDKREDREAARVRHQWEREERERTEKKVLAAVAENTGVTLATKDAVTAVAATGTISAEASAAILSNMLKTGDVVSPADVARVILEMRRSSATVERYAHENNHRINNLFQAMVAHFSALDPDSEIVAMLRKNLPPPKSTQPQKPKP